MPTLVDTIRIMNTQTTANKINLKGFMVGEALTGMLSNAQSVLAYMQVGNGCVGNEVGGCGRVSAIKIHVDFFHWHALFPQASDVYTEAIEYGHG